MKSSNWYKSLEGVRQSLLDIMRVSWYQNVSETLLWTTGSPQKRNIVSLIPSAQFLASHCAAKQIKLPA